jgi:hypothetical protein
MRPSQRGTDGSRGRFEWALSGLARLHGISTFPASPPIRPSSSAPSLAPTAPLPALRPMRLSGRCWRGRKRSMPWRSALCPQSHYHLAKAALDSGRHVLMAASPWAVRGALCAMRPARLRQRRRERRRPQPTGYRSSRATVDAPPELISAPCRLDLDTPDGGGRRLRITKRSMRRSLSHRTTTPT